MELTTDILMDFHKRQLEAWPLADAGFKGLAEVRCKEVEVGDVVFKVQHNRARGQGRQGFGGTAAMFPVRCPPAFGADGACCREWLQDSG